MGKHINIHMDIEAYRLIRARNEKGLRYFMKDTIRKALFGTAWTILGSDKSNSLEEVMHMAEELVQDAFIKLWEYPEKFDPRKNIPSCLKQEVRFRALNKLKKMSKTTLVSMEEVAQAATMQVEEHKPVMDKRLEKYKKFIYRSEQVPEQVFRCARYKYEHPEMSDKQLAQALGYAGEAGVKTVRKFRYRVKRKFFKAHPQYVG